MILQTYIPKSPLNQFVECLIYHEGYQPLHTVDRFLPDGNVEIIIDLDDKPKFIYDNQTLKEIQTCQHVWASGLRTEPISIYSGKGEAMFIISFKKGMAYQFFPFPMTEISDCVVDADLIWGSYFALLREQIMSTEEILKRFYLVESFLIKKFLPNFEINPCVEFALNQIINQPDQITLHKLNQKIGYSQRHFNSMFKKKVGITPKSFLKIMRFQKAIIEIEGIKEVDWTLISHDCGFYDQAHFINDFKLFSGFTPEDYAKRRGEYLNYIPVG